MHVSLHSPEIVEELINARQQPPSHIICTNHGFQCSKYSVFCCYNTAKASYKTYALVYIFQLITNTKKFKQNPKKQIPKFLWNYIKSVSFTAVDFLIMRRVMCLYHKYIGADANSLIISNILGGLYLAVESRNRQIEITLYCINKTTQTVYHCLQRRHPNLRIPYGEVLLFACSMALMCYYYFNHRELFRPAYQKAFGTILGKI